MSVVFMLMKCWLVGGVGGLLFEVNVRLVVKVCRCRSFGHGDKLREADAFEQVLMLLNCYFGCHAG